jgi:V8-like Glu-specific endopeptidase
VGGLVSYDDEGKYLICTGTLISPTVFMTAAHCLLDEPGDLYVSFDSFVGAPVVDEATVTLHHGQAFGHPEYVDSTAPGDTHDVGVVVLDEPVTGVRPASLPSKSLLSKLKRKALERTPFRVVGYGRHGFNGEEFFGGGGRRFAFSPFQSLESNKLFLSQDGGKGGTCRGDSGGPVFLGKSRTVVGITSDGDDFCESHSVNYRVDTKSARAFLEPFLNEDRNDEQRDDD